MSSTYRNDLLFSVLLTFVFVPAADAGAAIVSHWSFNEGAGSVQKFSGPFVPNSDLVPCGPYDTPETGTANWRAGQPTEFLTRKQKHRIRQNGEIESIRLYLANGAPSEFKLRIWRENASGKFDMVGTSADLASSFGSSPGFYTISLPEPISVREGDYIGYYLGATSSAIFHAQPGGSPPGYSYLLRGNLEGAQDVDFVNGYASGDRYAGHLTIETYMRAPSFVFIGDSIIQGATAHTSYLMDTIESAPETTIAYQFSQPNGSTARATSLPRLWGLPALPGTPPCLV